MDYEHQINDYTAHVADLEAQRQAALAAADAMAREQPVEALAKRGEAARITREINEACEAIRPALDAKAQAELQAMEPRFADIQKRLDAARAAYIDAIDRFLQCDPTLRALVTEHQELARQWNALANTLGAGHRQPALFEHEIRPVEQHVRKLTSGALVLRVRVA